jgi:hypothetical protein
MLKGQAIAAAAVLLLFMLTLRQHARWFQAVDRGLSWLARRRGLSIMLIGLLGFGASAMVSLGGYLPQPSIHDEFSYVLAADTFAHGRLANPPHPLWIHFESFHILQQPTYASKYPPAQGVMLAIGQVISGHPVVGVWLSTGLACAALCWMLLAWLPAGWALLGGGLAALHPGILLQWGHRYWGGMVAMMGGALLLGAVRRVMRRPRRRDALWLGGGLAVLANSRPFEGLVVSVPVAVALVAWMLGKYGPPARVSIGTIGLPVLIVLAVTGGAMGYYNWRVTGSALQLPYQVHEATYAVAPPFLWQRRWPEPSYRHAIIRDYYVHEMLPEYLEQRSLAGLVRGIMGKAKRLWFFWLALTLPLLMLPWVLRDRWSRFALVVCGVLMAALFGELVVFPHYAAPITGLVVVLALQGLRHLRVWRWHGKPMGRLIGRMAVTLTLASSLVASVQYMHVPPPAWVLERARILQQLTAAGGHHLVVVRYGPRHSPHKEWVYNAADIDAAPVVWAREMTPVQNGMLLDYFKDRQVWLAEVDRDQGPVRLVPYRLQ